METGTRDSKKTLGWAPQEDQKPAKPKSKNYFARHWRGDLSLGVSFWVNGIVVGLLFLAISPIMEGYLKNDLLLDSEAGTNLLLFGGVYLLVLLILMPWLFIGIWRSAGAVNARGGSGFWSGAAKVLVVLGVVNAVWDLGARIVSFGDIAPGLLAADHSGTGDRYRITVNNGVLTFSGAMEAGAARA